MCFQLFIPKCCRVFHAKCTRKYSHAHVYYSSSSLFCTYLPLLVCRYLGICCNSIFIYKYAAFHRHPGTQFDVCEIHTYAKYIQTCCADTWYLQTLLNLTYRTPYKCIHFCISLHYNVGKLPCVCTFLCVLCAFSLDNYFWRISWRVLIKGWTCQCFHQQCGMRLDSRHLSRNILQRIRNRRNRNQNFDQFPCIKIETEQSVGRTIQSQVPLRLLLECTSNKSLRGTWLCIVHFLETW